MCGPNITAFPASAGSTGFCPPDAVRLLPTNVTLANAYQSVSSPVVSTSRTSQGAAEGSALRRTTDTCNASNSASNPATRSTCRGAIARRSVGYRRCNRFKHFTNKTSSPSWVLPATQSGASSGIPDVLKSCRNSATRDATFAVWSNFMLPVRCNRSEATPTASQRARSSSSGIPTQSKSWKNGATHRLDLAKRPADLGERRAFASITGIPRASQSTIRFGQISPSTKTRPMGRIKSSVRRTAL